MKLALVVHHTQEWHTGSVHAIVAGRTQRIWFEWWQLRTLISTWRAVRRRTPRCRTRVEIVRGA